LKENQRRVLIQKPVFGEITGRVKDLTAVRRRVNSKVGKKTVDAGNRRKHFRPESFRSRFFNCRMSRSSEEARVAIEGDANLLIASQEVTLAPCIL